jgi:hypothetical protein
MKYTEIDTYEQDFIVRTKRHIQLVQHFAKMIAKLYPSIANNLLNDVKEHDASKFIEPEYSGYIWINAHYNLHIPYPSTEIEKLADDAWKYHYQHNDHHPEYFSDVNKMTKAQIAHMISDWKAMEYITTHNVLKLRQFYNTIAKKTYKFDKQHTTWIEQFILELEDKC